ncbi:DUF2062 domain-containing protein [Rhizobium straminoryzae]|uniref:DUF2062 domain-containing protein n=1 Tax=Rhizobium straminoryzae TaxID=1387186 RepID=UPI00163DCA10|nr:DUF2062 domain-containing protein [Rhizobium straminoryzae]
MRSLRYMRARAVRLTGSPHAVAIGFAVGVMSAWTPFFGFHIAIALAAAFLLRGSLVAATLGTAFSNPLTIPLILPLTWQIGHRMLDRAPDSGATAAALVRQLEGLHVTELWHPLFEPLTLGALPPAIVSGLCCYLATFVGIRKYRAARAVRFAARRAAARPVDKGSRV